MEPAAVDGLVDVAILDDDPDFTTYLEDALRDEGQYSVRAFAHPSDLFEGMEHRAPDIVMLDMKMGEFRGERVLEQLLAKQPGLCVIIVTGYPLPHGLLGGPDVPVLRHNLRRRLVALDPRRRFLREGREEISYFLGELPDSVPEPPHLVFAVGGAGAQVEMAFQFLPSLARRIRRKKLRITLVAGIRPEVAELFREAIRRAELTEELEAGGISILLANGHHDYFQQFNALLHDADILWTKPSELSFFGALGLPLLFSTPVGSHERYNRRWAIDGGSGLKQYDPRHAGDWLWEMLKDGTFAGAAWTGYMRMPKFGLYRIWEEVLGTAAFEACLTEQGMTRTQHAPSTLPGAFPLDSHDLDASDEENGLAESDVA